MRGIRELETAAREWTERHPGGLDFRDPWHPNALIIGSLVQLPPEFAGDDHTRAFLTAMIERCPQATITMLRCLISLWRRP